MNQISIIISIFSFIVAAIALGWNIYRDCIDKGRLKVSAYIAEIFIPGCGPQPPVISVRVINTGRKAIVVDGHSILMKDGTKLMPIDTYDAFHNRRLEPGEYISITLSNQLVLNLLDRIDQIYGFLIVDSYGKKWWLSCKEVCDIIKWLKEQKKGHA